jgi:hypothetical protein
MDAYTLEELRREYKAADVSGRIQLLAKFPKADDEDDSTAVSLPPELVRMAAEDDSATVRQWIARHGLLWNDSLKAVEDHLVNDPDPFVRACLMENRTHVREADAWRVLLFGTHLERLALMRNPNMARADEPINKIFDLEDKVEGAKDRLGRLGELGIDLVQRKELALAFVSNPAAQKDSRRDTQDFIDGGAWVDCRKRWATVWKLAAKWPRDSGVPKAVFRSFATEDEVKAEVYQQSTERFLRLDILYSCRGNELKTLKLGIADSDGTFRYAAYSRIWWYFIGTADLEAVLSGNDKDALQGLGENKSLPVEVLERIASKFAKEMGEYDCAAFVESNIKRIREKKPSPTDQLLDELAQIRDQLKDLESAIENVRPNQLPDELAQLQNQLKVLESSIERFRSGQSPMGQAASHAQRDSRSKWIITIVLATGVALLVGAPLGITIGCGLIGVAIAMRFAK